MNLSPARKRQYSSIFTTALEGGISYWATIEEYHWKKEGVPDTATMEEMVDVDGFYATVTEEGDPTPLRIDASTIHKAIKAILDGTATFGGQPLSPNGRIARLAKALDKSPTADPDYDAGDADNLVQIGLFGDVVYG